jgi:hypothetical protein
MQTYEVILKKNETVNPKVKIPGAIIFVSQRAGVVIHRISKDTALRISELIKKEEALTYVSRALSLAFLSQESLFDPEAKNKNYKYEDMSAWDVGLCQLNLGVLSREKKLGFNGDLFQAQAFAYDITKAIPWKYQLILRNTVAAKRFLRLNPEYKIDPWLLGCQMYNAGPTGAIRMLKAGLPLEYAEKIKKLEQEYAAELGLPSMFKD